MCGWWGTPTPNLRFRKPLLYAVELTSLVRATSIMAKR